MPAKISRSLKVLLVRNSSCVHKCRITSTIYPQYPDALYSQCRSVFKKDYYRIPFKFQKKCQNFAVCNSSPFKNASTLRVFVSTCYMFTKGSAILSNSQQTSSALRRAVVSTIVAAVVLYALSNAYVPSATADLSSPVSA